MRNILEEINTLKKQIELCDDNCKAIDLQQKLIILLKETCKDKDLIAHLIQKK